jgi:tetratricopeptide (TPR) repeat protein
MIPKMSISTQKKPKKAKFSQPIKSISVRSMKKDLLLGFFLFVAMLAAYQPAWKGAMIWDDDQHITRPDLRSINGLTRIWTELGATQQYYPLVHSVFWLEYHLWGEATLGYHLVNILLHFFSALLLVCILRRLAIPGAWFVAAIFALHPIQIESVAWITELKNTLSGVFFFATVLTYLKFDSERKRKWYIIAICLFIMGLLSKSVIATLPVSLLVVFWWKRGKLNWKQDIEPLIPFFVVGIASGLFTAWVERKFIGAEGSEFNFTIIERCLIAGRTVWFYLGKIIWPFNLIFIYPRWNVSQAIWWQYLFPLATLILAGATWMLRQHWRAPLAVFIYFTAMLFPVMGFFNVYPFQYSFVADHFQYLACIGPIALVAFGIGWALGFLKRNIRLTLYMIILMILGGLSWKQCGIYTDAAKLFTSTIQKNPNCWMAYNNLGAMLIEKGQTNEAIDRYRKSLEIKPDNEGALTNLASGLFKIGQTDEAIAYFEKALQINPKLAEAHNNFGHLLFQTGRTDEAFVHYMKALELKPNYPEAHNNLGILLEKNGRIDEAIDHYKKALAINPDVAEVQNNLGTLLAKIGRADEAIVCFQKALKIKPNYPEALNSFGVLLAQIGRPDKAITQYRKALEINPNYSEAHCNLGNALFQTGFKDEAITHLNKALEINPNYADAHNNLGNALFQTGHPDEAIAQFKMALEITPDKISMLKNLAIAYVRMGKLTDAIPLVEKALALAKSSGDESLVKEITVNLDQLIKMSHLGHQSQQ